MNSELKKLMDTDIQFCEDCKSMKEKGWMKYLAPQSLMGTSSDNPYIDDNEEINLLMMKVFNLENIEFIWKPKYAFISDDNTLGVTTGIYNREYVNNKKVIMETGKYTTIWKKTDGLWKIVFDMGN